ncbi:MAG: cytochrome C, partial [Sphingomonadales bacterium]
MRIWQWLALIIVVLGIGAAVFFLRPVNGPARDLTLVGDATRGAYLLRLGDC